MKVNGIIRKRMRIGLTTKMMIDWIFDGGAKAIQTGVVYTHSDSLQLTFNSFLMSSQLKKEANEQKKIKSIIIIQLTCRCCVRSLITSQSVKVKQRLIIIHTKIRTQFL